MTRTVWIIGTGHEYQKVRSDVHDPGSEQFRAMVATTAAAKGVRALAEEMSPEALRADDSVCRQVAKSLQIAHRYCDPSSGERTALGIVADDDIRWAGFYANRDQQDIENDVQAAWAIRENRWLEHLLDLGAWPVLFVCGADHAESFRDGLRAHGIEANLLISKWVPK